MDTDECRQFVHLILRKKTNLPNCQIKITVKCTAYTVLYYCMEGNFGGGKHWRIWRMTVDLPNLSQPQLKKVSRDKIHLR